MASPRLAFSKIVGTGNDFLFVDGRKGLPDGFGSIARPELARKLCDRHAGAGADGLVIVEQSGEKLRWDFYNSDGSVAEMCGNATRCMGRWAQHYLGVATVEFDTLAGHVRASVVGHEICSRLEFVKVIFEDISFNGQQAVLVNTGVPHVVVETDSLERSKNARELIAGFRHHEDAGPRGANVTFLQPLGSNRFATVSFERGVEGFTLSCGTGVLAAAAVGLRKSGAREAFVTAPGGQLSVNFGSDWSGAELKGPATFLFEASFSQEALK